MLWLQLRFYLEGWLEECLKVQVEQQCVKTFFDLLISRLILMKDDFGLAYDPLLRGVL